MGKPSKRPVLALLSERARVGTVGRLSPWATQLFQSGWFGRFLRAWFRPEMTGWERLPKDRPYLLVANHSGGGASDVGALLVLWAKQFGAEGNITGLAHPFAWHVPIVKTVLHEVGAVPSTYEQAQAAFEQGVSVLVFPGGDHDAFRPVWRASHVDFNQRKGFLRIARQAWVPIVPLGIRGSHYTNIILWRSRFLLPWGLVLPRALGIKRFPLTVAGASGVGLILWLTAPLLGTPAAAALAWFWIVNPFVAMIPAVPWKIRCAIGEPIEPEELFGSRESDGPLQDAYDQVVGAVQRLVAPDQATGSPEPASA